MNSITPHLPLIICLIGIILWGIFRHAKDVWPSEVGKVMFAAGLFVYFVERLKGER